jgi:hypothetical protein
VSVRLSTNLCNAGKDQGEAHGVSYLSGKDASKSSSATAQSSPCHYVESLRLGNGPC